MQTTSAASGWDVLNTTAPVFEDGQKYSAIVDEVRQESSKLYPGTNFLRIFFTVADRYSRTKKMSWISSGNMEKTKEMLGRLGPDALTKLFPALQGMKCEVVVALGRGVCVAEIVAQNQK